MTFLKCFLIENQNFNVFSSHNTHHYLKFFESIRNSVKNDSLDALIKRVDQQYKIIDLTEKVRKEKRERLDEDDNVSMTSVS